MRAAAFYKLAAGACLASVLPLMLSATATASPAQARSAGELRTPARASSSALATIAAASSLGTTLHAGQILNVNHEIRLSSAAGTDWLIQQSDGNLVMYFQTDPRNPVLVCWSSHTNGKGSNLYTIMQDDGNLVTYKPFPYGSDIPEWASHTVGRKPLTTVMHSSLTGSGVPAFWFTVTNHQIPSTSWLGCTD